MREINLQEYQQSEAIPLSPTERDALTRGTKVTIEPASGTDGKYWITPGSTIGAVEIGDLSVLIEPKIGIPQVLSLACYAIGEIRFQPEDFDFPEERSCVFVGDAKYKNMIGDRIPNADLYQMLAYATALDLPGGLLIYAQGEADAATHLVRHSGKRLEVAVLDLSGRLNDVLARVKQLAEQVVALRWSARN